MKGFVPVKKNRLLSMIDKCRVIAQQDYVKKVDNSVAAYIISDKERTRVRRWYRLWTLPAPRFTYNEQGVRDFAERWDYDMFEYNPFDTLKENLDHSLSWLDRLQRVAETQNSEEPIMLAISNFLRLDEPERYKWTSSNFLWRIE